MLQTVEHVEHPTLEELRHLHPLDRLDEERLRALAQIAPRQHAGPGTTLLALGASERTLLYLLRGEVELRAEDGAVQHIRHDQPSARSPIARLRPSHYQVVARTPVTYLVIPESALDESTSEAPSTAGLEVYEVVEESADSPDELADQLIYQLYEDLNGNQLLLPSLPDVAIRVGQAVNHDLADAKRVARVIENDPVIAAKLIRVANSARYGGAAPLATLPEAITRLGLATTHRLVITFALRELFRSNSPRLKELMKLLWNEARQVAAICHVLARRCDSLDPDTALLAGLVHNIGEVAVLGYLRDFPELAAEPDTLRAVVTHLGRQIGPRILEKWDFPTMLVKAVRALGEAGDEPVEGCDYGDLLVVAHHQYLAARGEGGDQAPAAYQRLAMPGASPETIREVLEAAQQELQETLALLGD